MKFLHEVPVVAALDVLGAARSRILADIVQLPKCGVPSANLTEGQRFALSVAAGAPFESHFEHRDGGYFVTFKTTAPCGVCDRGDGGYVVGIGPKAG